MMLLAIFAGGAIGATARFFVAGALQRRARSGFRWGTLAVNVTGCLLLGLLVPLLLDHPPYAPLRVFALTGCIGAFTTFSTFAHDALVLLQARRPAMAFAYVLASVLLGLVALFAGVALMSRLA